ncbi:hypothetical protein B0A55_12661 [Friedmanniomyces simplex]|uniref:Uncharacterized protein n=1 Tax=Friedmanniomyces simplex TaxID=329884 RepID=A0A4U0W3M9_9PEZI|nr:hypothetical protein B0A55_12661 [Friedmanniomyces simplex]
MHFYDIIPPYSADYYTNHYLGLWEITPEEVVGTWEWDVLMNDVQWYEHEVLPALRAHQKALRRRHIIERNMNSGVVDDEDKKDDEHDEREDHNDEDQSRAGRLEDDVLAASLAEYAESPIDHLYDWFRCQSLSLR